MSTTLTSQMKALVESHLHNNTLLGTTRYLTAKVAANEALALALQKKMIGAEAYKKPLNMTPEEMTGPVTKWEAEKEPAKSVE